MNFRLYHKDIWMPIDLIEQCLFLQRNLGFVLLTKHIEYNLNNKDWHHFSTKKEIMECIKYIRNNPIIPFEVEEQNNVVTKYAIKIKLERKDLILVFRNNKLITFYTNHKNDEHFSLDETKYVKRKY